MNDEPIQATNDDASECKRCAVQLGYWQDNYISYFIKSIDRRAPEINRGYFARVKGVDILTEKFLKKAGDQAQIINLGCGFDTLYWRLKDRDINIKNYIEVDFPTVTARKCYMIKKHKQLLEKIHDQEVGEIKLSPTELHAGNYHLLGADLRNIHELDIKLSQSEIDFQAPTLILAECVLVYIDIDSVNKLLTHLREKFQTTLFINYEMVNLHDVFGNIMLENLRARGCTLSGVSACQSLDSQQDRFRLTGWQGTKAWDMVHVYESIPGGDRSRIEKIEFLDEKELLTQLFQHYCICVAWCGDLFSDIDIT